MKLIALVFLVSLPAAVRGEEVKWTTLFEQARAAAQEERDAEAEQFIARAWAELKKAGAEAEGFAAAVDRIARFYRDSEQFRQAERIYQEALALAPSDDLILTRLQLLTGLEWMYFDSERTVKAAAVSQQALDTASQHYGPKSGEAGIALGLRFLAESLLGEFTKAEETLDLVLSIDKPHGSISPIFLEYPTPRYEDLISTAGEIGANFYTQRELPDKAEALLRRVAGLPLDLPDRATMMQRLIRHLEQQGKSKEAAEEKDALLRMLETSPGTEARRLADDLRSRPRPAPASDERIETLRTSHPGEISPWNKAESAAEKALQDKHYDAAAANIKTLIALAPVKTRRLERQAMLARVVALISELSATPARDDRLIAQVEALLDVDLRRSPPVTKRLAEYYVKNGQFAKAYRLLDRWVEAVRDANGNDARELDTIAAYYADVRHRERDHRGALRECSDWISTETAARGRFSAALADAHFKMADIYVDQEDFSRAASSLDDGIAIASHWSFDDPTAYRQRLEKAAALFRRLKKPERAAELEERVSKLNQ